MRGARKGASGLIAMTAEHLKVCLNSNSSVELLYQFAQEVVDANLPPDILDAISLGRLTALLKPGGGVRGIVAGDILRRLVGRTVAQQLCKDVEEATAPFQYALSTRAGIECVAHIIQHLTAESGSNTVFCIDGISAFDSISREAMLIALQGLPLGAEALPFVRQFYGSPSRYIWTDDQGTVHSIPQGEGREQGDAMMPLLYALGQHKALVNIAAQLKESEKLLAFLDDIYVVCQPDRVGIIFETIKVELWDHAKIRINDGKTKVWNSAGIVPEGIESLGDDVWKGSSILPDFERGLNILGTPIGTEAYVKAVLRKKLDEQKVLLEAIPFINNVQSAWLLLLYCGSSRANYLCRVVDHHYVVEYMEGHDFNISACFYFYFFLFVLFVFCFVFIF